MSHSIKEDELLTEIKLEKQEVDDPPVIIQTIQQNYLDSTQIKQEYEENFECELPDDDDYGEIEVLDEYIEEVKNMSPQKFKIEIKEEPEVINETKVIKLEPATSSILEEAFQQPKKMNLRGVKINLNKILGTKAGLKTKSVAQTFDPADIDVPNCFNTSERPFRCKKCPLSFKLRKDLAVHRAIHKKADFWCKKCGQKFRFQSSFHNHDCDFWCTICGKRISNKANLKIHLSYVHGIGDAKLFTCDLCGNTYKSKRNIDTHMKNHMESTPYNCAICGKGFSHAGALKIHMWNHRDLVTCEICKKKFKPRSLYYHIKRCRQMFEEGQLQQQPIYRHQKVERIDNSIKCKVIETKPVYVIKVKDEVEKKPKHLIQLK